jgi:hypothetical protein
MQFSKVIDWTTERSGHSKKHKVYKLCNVEENLESL